MPQKQIMRNSPREYVYDKVTDPLPFYYFPLIGKLYRKRVELCLELLPCGGRVLEIGFGSGLCMPNLNVLYNDLHGIDLNSDCQAVANTFSVQGITANLINGSVVNLPYPDNYFDAILLVSILEHLKNDELELSFGEIRRVLVDGGTMVYGVPVERPFMTFSFRLLGCKIREHHFSTNTEIAAVSGKYLVHKEQRLLGLLPWNSLTVYEAQRFMKN